MSEPEKKNTEKKTKMSGNPGKPFYTVYIQKLTFSVIQGQINI